MDYLTLIDNLVAQGCLKTPLIIEAFKNINRADFVPEESRKDAGFDIPLPIGHGQTISQPFTVAFMLELLQPVPSDRILDIGSGSGWTSALLARCVGTKGKTLRQAQGKVFAVERVSEICEFGKRNISKYNLIEKGIVEMVCADGAKGLPQEAPFDRILVSASAQKLPEVLKKQLKIGGRMVVPVQNSIWLVVRKSEEKFEEKEFSGFVFVPLISD